LYVKLCKFYLELSYISGKHSDDKNEDLKGQISKGVANYVSAYIDFSVFCNLESVCLC